MQRNLKDDYLEEFRKSLPIYQFKDEIINVVKENLFCIITGDTGSGKTTQIPRYILENLSLKDLSDSSSNLKVKIYF